MSADGRGSSQISVYVYGVTDDQLDDVMTAIADALIAQGFNVGEDVQSLLAARGFVWPEQAGDFIEMFEADGYGRVMIPSPEEAAT